MALFAALIVSGCQRKKPIVVGSKSGAEQMLLAEIIAQHLETRLAGVSVIRRPETAGTPILFQAIAAGDITVYPETPVDISTGILKEPPSPDPGILLERVRLEMARIAQLDVIELGFEDGPAVVIQSDGNAGEDTLSAAAQGKARWKLAVTPEFEQSADFHSLNLYHLPLAAPMRTLDASELFDAMTQGDVNMVVTTVSDGHLTTPQWKVLQDDKKAFLLRQVCLLARQDRLTDQPGLRAALGELSGKLSADAMRKLNRQVGIDNRDPAAVAREFLQSVGLR